MTVDTTIGVSKEAKEAAQDAKHKNETWDEFIKRCTEQPPEIVEFRPASDGGTVDNEAIYNMRDELIAAINASTGDVATTEDMADLAGEIQDMKAQLPKDVAEELK